MVYDPVLTINPDHNMTLATGAGLMSSHGQGPSHVAACAICHWVSLGHVSRVQRGDSYLLLGSAGLLDDKFGDVGGLGVSHGLVSVLAGSPGLCSLTDDHRSTTIRLRLSRGEEETLS